MEIIKKGKPPIEQTATFDCHNCKSTLKATRGEGERRDDRDGIWYFFTCPVCHERLGIHAKKFS
jgi:C4-type Zn-finger protein